MCGILEIFVEWRNRKVKFNMWSQWIFVERVVEDPARHKPNKLVLSHQQVAQLQFAF